MALDKRFQVVADWWASLELTVNNKRAFIPGVVLVDENGEPYVASGGGGGGGDVNLNEVGGVAFAQGARAIASSLSVTPATSSTWAASQSGTWNITNISGTIPLPTGAATSANQTTTIAALGAPADVAWTSGNGTHTSLLKTIATAALDASPALVALSQSEYETVAASQTDQMLGSTGAIGDYLAGLLIVPATTSPGQVSIEDGSTNIIVFTGGASSVSNLVPFFVPLGISSVSGGWEVTTGTNVSVIASGQFT